MRNIFLGVSAAALALAAAPAFADDAPAAPAPFLKFSGHIEVGITANPDVGNVAPCCFVGPKENFGHLFTDRANVPLLNQASFTVEHDPDTASKKPTLGFKIQGVYGSDARYSHTLGIFDETGNSNPSINQFTLFEADVQAHLPIFTAGGVDVKAGIYPTLEGAEVNDATGNFFYSHNYIFNFGVPNNHTGVMTITHFKNIDLYLGVDSGVNTSFGSRGDNNGAPAFHGGIGYNGKNVTILASTHIGPETSRLSGISGFGKSPNSALRWLNDIVVIWKITPKLTSTTDINYIKDDYARVDGGGVSEQLVYTITDQVSLGLRGEVFSDGGNFFVGAYPFNNEAALALKYGGDCCTSIPDYAIGGASTVQNTTYGAVTFGLNWKPKVHSYTKNFGLLIRPEARFDTSLGKSDPFYGSGFLYTPKKSQFTVGIDGIISF